MRRKVLVGGKEEEIGKNKGRGRRQEKGSGG